MILNSLNFAADYTIQLSIGYYDNYDIIIIKYKLIQDLVFIIIYFEDAKNHGYLFSVLHEFVDFKIATTVDKVEVQPPGWITVRGMNPLPKDETKSRR